MIMLIWCVTHRLAFSYWHGFHQSGAAPPDFRVVVREYYGLPFGVERSLPTPLIIEKNVHPWSAKWNRDPEQFWHTTFWSLRGQAIRRLPGQRRGINCFRLVIQSFVEALGYCRIDFIFPQSPRTQISRYWSTTRNISPFPQDKLYYTSADL